MVNTSDGQWTSDQNREKGSLTHRMFFHLNSSFCSIVALLSTSFKLKNKNTTTSFSCLHQIKSVFEYETYLRFDLLTRWMQKPFLCSLFTWFVVQKERKKMERKTCFDQWTDTHAHQRNAELIFLVRSCTTLSIKNICTRSYEWATPFSSFKFEPHTYWMRSNNTNGWKVPLDWTPFVHLTVNYERELCVIQMFYLSKAMRNN